MDVTSVAEAVFGGGDGDEAEGLGIMTIVVDTGSGEVASEDVGVGVGMVGVCDVVPKPVIESVVWLAKVWAGGVLEVVVGCVEVVDGEEATTLAVNVVDIELLNVEAEVNAAVLDVALRDSTL